MDFSELKEKAEEIRRLWGENDAKRDAGQETPDDIVRYDDGSIEWGYSTGGHFAEVMT